MASTARAIEAIGIRKHEPYDPPAFRGVVLFFWAPRAGLLALLLAPPSPPWPFWPPRMFFEGPTARRPRAEGVARG